MKQQKGFVLVSVLIITTITTMLAFSQLSENRLQERIAGNQQKEINARLAAEKGIFAAFGYIDASNKAGDTNNQILASLTKEGEYYTLTVSLPSLTSFAIESQGEYQGATAYLKTNIAANEEIGSSFFDNAVAGCDGVAIGSGGGIVDSYNSKAGYYGKVLADGSINQSENGGVGTINEGADVVLSGSGSVYGNIISNGGISTGTSAATQITGSMTAKGDIQLKDITSSGDMHAGGNFSFQAVTATAPDTAITVVGNLDSKGSNTFADSVSFTYGGSNNTGFGVYSDSIVAPDFDLGECDLVSIPGTPEVKGITAVMKSITDEADGLSSVSSADMTAATYTFTEDSVSSGSVSSGLSPVTGGTSSTIAALGAASGLGALDENTKVIIIDVPDDGSLDLGSKTIQIDGNVTLLIKGDILTKDTTFSFTNADTSSLTILTTGKINVLSGTDLFSGETVNSEGKPPLTVYSSYESDTEYALNLTANPIIYTKLYAPLGNLNLIGGAQIMGAVRGKNVNIAAGTAIHYDEVLSTLNDKIETEAVPASYSAIYYYYPSE